MDPNRWKYLKELLGPALELGREARMGFLERTCSDPDLRREAESFLEAYALDSGFLEDPVIAPAPTKGGPSGDALLGERIGSYQLVRQLGEGGMGEVFLAEQSAPIYRKVALKLVRPDRENRKIAARFEAERQAMALMSHPNIAQVLEAGDSDSGRPFLVMEYVEGRPITEHCDAERLSIEKRLELFIAVCRGIQHAHQKGVIHRDVKPSNVLVAIEDGRAVPKVIDFGIAKATTSPAGEAPFLTRQGDWIGTPEYTSPEQAGGAEGAADARSDVYSLGALLYELLAGALPFDVSGLREAGLSELLRTLREVESPKMSERVCELSERAPDIARARRLDVAGLIRRLRGDLDCVAAKTLEKEPDRRYASAAELAADLERHLRHEPLVAGPPGTLFQFVKLVRRYRIAITVLGVLFLSLAAGTVGTAIGWVKARRAERMAQQQAREAHEEAFRANREALTAARVTDFLADLFDASDPASYSSGPGLTLRAVLDRGAQRAREELADEPLVQARLTGVIGRSYLGLGQFSQARDLLESSLRLHRQHLGDDDLLVAENLHQLSTLFRELADYEASRTHLVRTLEIRRKILGPDHRDVATALNDLGIVLTRLGEAEAARKNLEQALSIKERLPEVNEIDVAITLGNLGLLLVETGEWERGEPLLQRTLAIHERGLGPDHPEVSISLNNLALAKVSGGDRAAAAHLLRRALDIDEKAYGPDHHYVAVGLYNLAELTWEKGDCRQAEPLYVRAQSILTRTYAASHPKVMEISETVSRLREECE